jgi:hypothetical protein
MVVDEIKGKSIEEIRPKNEKVLKNIMKSAGKQLAIIHSVKVDGFGWINRNYHDILKGEKNHFNDYFNEYLESDLQSLHQYSFTEKEINYFMKSMNIAQKILFTESAVLVHGDFDLSHIFYSQEENIHNNNLKEEEDILLFDMNNEISENINYFYSGLIDFGEIRGNHKVFDFATFILFYQERELYSYLIDGYREISQFNQEDIYATEFMALFIILRFLGKYVTTKKEKFFFTLAKTQLDFIISKYESDLI